MSIRKEAIPCGFHHTPNHLSILKCFVVITRNYTNGSKTYKTTPRPEITLRLLKKPLAIRPSPFFQTPLPRCHHT